MAVEEVSENLWMRLVYQCIHTVRQCVVGIKGCFWVVGLGGGFFCVYARAPICYVCVRCIYLMNGSVVKQQTMIGE